MREDLLDRYSVDEEKVKEFKEVFSFKPPSTEKQMEKSEL